jgi:hypothetical protein
VAVVPLPVLGLLICSFWTKILKKNGWMILWLPASVKGLNMRPGDFTVGY